MRERYLVVNGADFGVNHAHNIGVQRAFTEGILTTACIISAAPWFPEAVRLAKEHTIPVGLHMTYACEYEGYTFGPLTRAPELSRDGKGYAFPKSTLDIDAKHANAVKAEIRAQLMRMLDAGLRVDYIEGHMNCIPRGDGAFADTVAAIWDEFKIPTRPPMDRPPVDGTPYLECDSWVSPSLGLPFEEKKQFLLELLEKLEPGIHWMATHPNHEPEETTAAKVEPSVWGGDLRTTDMQVLIDCDVKKRVEELEIKLIDCAEAGRILGLPEPVRP